VNLEKRDNYFFLKIQSANLTDFSKELDSLMKDPVNLILGLDKELINNSSLILSLLKYSSFWKKSHKSFILVVEDFIIENKNLVSVPTLNEAIDYLYMEELERNV
tara:strand:- start:444 stop:758 length:315 start_codon:yes stop_codon:yes gene_type:complete